MDCGHNYNKITLLTIQKGHKSFNQEVKAQPIKISRIVIKYCDFPDIFVLEKLDKIQTFKKPKYKS